MALSPYYTNGTTTPHFYLDGFSPGKGGLVRQNDGKFSVIEKSPAFILGEQLRRTWEGVASLWRSFLTLPAAEASTVVPLPSSKDWKTKFDALVEQEPHAPSRTALVRLRVEYLDLVIKSEARTAELEGIVEREYRILTEYCLSYLKISKILEKILLILKQGEISEFSPGELKKLDLYFPIHRVSEGIIYKNGIIQLPPQGVSLDTARCSKMIRDFFFIDHSLLRFPLHTPREDMSLSEFKQVFSPESIHQLEKDIDHWIMVTSRIIEREIVVNATIAGDKMKEPLRNEVSTLFRQIHQQLPLTIDYYNKHLLGIEGETITITPAYFWEKVVLGAASLLLIALAVAKFRGGNSPALARENGEQAGNPAVEDGDGTPQPPQEPPLNAKNAPPRSQPVGQEGETTPALTQAVGTVDDPLKDQGTLEVAFADQLLSAVKKAIGDQDWVSYAREILPKLEKEGPMTRQQMTLFFLAEAIAQKTGTTNETLLTELDTLRRALPQTVEDRQLIVQES